MTKRDPGGPLVSVIVPMWNAERTIARTLRSVSGQTYHNLEIIIVDDGSTDSSARVAAEFCKTERRAGLIRKDNGGVASARNRGIREAAGEWIAPIDADDLWHPTRIEKMMAAGLAARQPIGFVYCWQRAIDEGDVIVSSERGWAYAGPAFRQFTYINAVGGGSGLLLPRDSVEQVGGYDETLRARHAQGCEDMMIQLRLARTLPVAVVPEYLVGWRQHGNNMSGDMDQMRRSYELVYRALADEGAPIPQEVMRWTDANWRFELAQEAAVARRYGGVVRHLASAIRLDPAGTGAMLAYRLIRSIVRRAGGPSSVAGRKFQEVEPTAEISTDPHELPRLLSLKTRLHEARLKHLALLDRMAMTSVKSCD